MANSTITFTPMDNIDFSKMTVIDNNKVQKRTFDSRMDTFKMKFKQEDERMDTLINASVYDDVVTIDGVPCKLLHMLTK